MERVAGIGPASSAWKAEVLPLYHTRKNTLVFHQEQQEYFKVKKNALPYFINTFINSD